VGEGRGGARALDVKLGLTHTSASALGIDIGRLAAAIPRIAFSAKSRCEQGPDGHPGALSRFSTFNAPPGEAPRAAC